MESTIPKTNAHKNPSITNPGTILLTNIIKRAFKTSVNKPSDKIFIGRVRINSRGFKNAFIIPNTKATANAAIKPVTCTPGIIYAMEKITIAEIIQLINIFIQNILYNFYDYFLTKSSALGILRPGPALYPPYQRAVEPP